MEIFNGQTNYLSMKVIVYLINFGNYQFFQTTADLSYDQKFWHFEWLHTRHPDLQLWNLVLQPAVGTLTTNYIY